MHDLAARIANDFRFFDGMSAVTLTPQNPPGTPIPDIQANWGVVTRAQIAQSAEIALEPDDVSVSMWVSTLQGVTPKNGDKVTDADGVHWRLISTAFSTLNTRYLCIARKWSS